MAIDTAEKRKSLVGLQYWSGPGVTPNASPDQEWRQEAGYSYSGILAGGAPVVPEPGLVFVEHERRADIGHHDDGRWRR